MRAAIRPRFEQAVDPAPAGGRTAGARSASGVTVLRRVAPGRVRLDVAGLYRCDFLRELIEAELRRLPAVEAASGSVLTGHVLMMFGQGGRLDEVIGRIDALCRRQLGLDRPPGVGIVGPKARPIRPANAPGRTVRRPAPKSAVPRNSGDWHRIGAGEVLADLETSARGLTPAESGRRLDRFGANSLPRAEPRSSLGILLGQFASLPVALLGASAVLSLATGGMADALVIVGVVLINATIGFFTEVQAERTINALASTSPHSALLVRDGTVVQAPARIDADPEPAGRGVADPGDLRHQPAACSPEPGVAATAPDSAEAASAGAVSATASAPAACEACSSARTSATRSSNTSPSSAAVSRPFS
jgi:Ca2+-transporting ATPase